MTQAPQLPNEIHVRRLGVVAYRDALAVQAEVQARRQADELPDTLLLLEHPPVYTRGRRAAGSSCPSARTSTAARGIEIVHTDRGGRSPTTAPASSSATRSCAYSDIGAHLRKMETRNRRGARRRRHRGALAPRGGHRLHRRVGGASARSPRSACTSRGRRHARLRRERRQRPRSRSRWIVPCGLPDVAMTSVARELDARAHRSRRATPASAQPASLRDASAR